MSLPTDDPNVPSLPVPAAREAPGPVRDPSNSREEPRSRGAGSVVARPAPSRARPPALFDDQADAATLDGHASALDAEIQDIMVIMEDLRFQLEHTRDINAALRGELTIATEQLAIANASLGAREAEVSQLGTRETVLLDERTRFIEELDAAAEDRQEATVEIHRLKEVIAAGEQQLERLRGQVQGVQAASDALRQEGTAREQRLADVIESLERRIEKLEGEVDLRERELYTANATISDLRGENARLIDQVRAMQRSCAAIERVHQAMQSFRQQMVKPEGDV